ncbi:MAG: hypothetical protein SPK84_07145 [Synergistales bacterium]|nr:hypothetical protein [Synergistales bacterium]MDY6404554.1 hypothetical protein [Synergistales bacterium]MDY6425141.1 hypothetical protein [Synergistales bacterium]MDY6429170.1 hypothetical protein [Synergistales bacterium]MDY6434292.1 hypothetical protein [Synergistales bacterium]
MKAHYSFVERINSVNALTASAKYLNTDANTLRSSTRVFTALTPFKRGRYTSATTPLL